MEQGMEETHPLWVPPRLVALAASGDARNALDGMGDIDMTYSGFPYGYS